MTAITATEARRRLFPLIQQVNEDQDVVEILSKNGNAFLVSEDQWRSTQETLHLMRTPAHAQRLLASIAEIDAGQGERHELTEP